MKPYWFYNIEHASESTQARPTGYGRMITHAFAKFLYDAGKIESTNGNTNMICPGYIMFSGNIEDENIFMGIGHCYFIGGFIGHNLADQILIESISNRYGGVITRGWNSPYNASTKLRYLPPMTGVNRMNAAQFRRYHEELLNQDLNTSHLVWNDPTGYAGARVVCVTTNTSTTYPLTIQLTNTKSNEVISNTVSFTGGSYVFYYPEHWNLELSTTATSRTVNIVKNVVCSDKEIIIPCRS